MDLEINKNATNYVELLSFYFVLTFDPNASLWPCSGPKAVLGRSKGQSILYTMVYKNSLIKRLFRSRAYVIIIGYTYFFLKFASTQKGKSNAIYRMKNDH